MINTILKFLTPKKFNLIFFFKFFFLISFILNYNAVLWVFQDPLQIVNFFSKLNFNNIIEFYVFKINNIGKIFSKDLTVISSNELFDLHESVEDSSNLLNNDESSSKKNFYLKIIGGIIFFLIVGLIYYNYGGGSGNNIPNIIIDEDDPKKDIVSTGVYIREFPKIYARACPPMEASVYAAFHKEMLIRKIKSLRLGEAAGMTAEELALYVQPEDLPELRVMAKALGFSIDAIAYQVAVLKTGNSVIETVGNFVFENGFNFEILGNLINKMVYESMQVDLQNTSDLSFLKRMPQIMEEATKFLNSGEWTNMTKSEVEAKIVYILHYSGRK